MMKKTREDFTKEMDQLKNEIEDHIINLLKNSDELKNFLSFRKNFFKQYSIRNCLLIHKQNPEATIVAGFHRWKELGYKVKKGEKGLSILLPLFRKHKSDDELQYIYGYKRVPVFDISQTEPTENAVSTPQINVSLLDTERVIENHEQMYDEFKEVIGQYSEIEEDENLEYYGMTDGKKIYIKKHPDNLVMTSTLVHEFVHYYNHFKDNRNSLSKNQKEVEAEIGVVIVGSYFNFDVSGSYNYIFMYKDEADIQKAFDLALKTAELILYGDENNKGIIKEVA